ncbi:MAG: hypothetical protein DI586_09305 [Micavibrio aeruginosavorus]|uniref:Prepilin-type N-terminal cleavage/methylation domain-containing protein n=1 Tax=Micavibrio aeruginosavorus TaxID=349221 RepID=A0A2W5FLE8_9BACT|nr:MAG: hypothetical protein DI586_09305 [Micavibrio aeruginosavorus]
MYGWSRCERFSWRGTTMQLKSFNHKNSQSGFTLLELSIVVVISVLLTMAIIKFSEGYQEQIKHEETKRSITNANTAVAKFYELAGRYPCPADKSLNPGDAQYGKENCSLPSIPGARDIDSSGSTTDEQVLVGVFPTYATVTPETGSPYEVTLAELIDDNEALNPNITDAWGNVPLYAVTKVLTVPYDDEHPTTTFDTYRGAIAIVDENGRDTGGTKQDAHFVIISTGPDAMGSKSLSSGYNESCSDGSYSLQKSNCDLADSTFVSGLRSTGSDEARYFDDYVAFASTMPMTLWSKDSSNGVSTVTKGNVGIGTSAPKDKVQIGDDPENSGNGSTLLVDRLTYSEQLCDVADASKCISPQSLVGLSCPDHLYMKSISMSNGALTPLCVELNLTQNVTCPNGYVRGIDTDEGVKCIDKLPIKLESTWVTAANEKSESVMEEECRAIGTEGWTTTAISDNNDDPVHSLSEKNSDSSAGRMQLCMRTTDPKVILTAQWVSGTCPSDTKDTGLRDNADDKHNLNEKAAASNNMKFCLGVSGRGVVLQTRWVSHNKRYPACGSDEISVINAKNNAKNLNDATLEDNNSYETLCAKLVLP